RNQGFQSLLGGSGSARYIGTPVVDQPLANLWQGNTLVARLINHMLQGGTQSKVVGTGREKAGTMAGILNTVRKCQQLGIVVKNRSEHLVDCHAGDGRRTATNEHQAFIFVAVRAPASTTASAVLQTVRFMNHFHRKGFLVRNG